jgi:hypothetical protein
METIEIGDADPEIVALEAMLRAAQLNADVEMLGRLISDSLLFTGPDGNLATKADDLAAHASSRTPVAGFVGGAPTERPPGWIGRRRTRRAFRQCSLQRLPLLAREVGCRGAGFVVSGTRAATPNALQKQSLTHTRT